MTAQCAAVSLANQLSLPRLSGVVYHEISTIIHGLPACHSLSLSLALHFNGHFPGGSGLAGARMSAFWILLELRRMEVVVATGAIRRAKLQSDCHHQQTNTQRFTGRMSFLLYCYWLMPVNSHLCTTLLVLNYLCIVSCYLTYHCLNHYSLCNDCVHHSF